MKNRGSRTGASVFAMRFGFDRHLVKSRIDPRTFPNSNALFVLCHEHHFGELGSFVKFRRLWLVSLADSAVDQTAERIRPLREIRQPTRDPLPGRFLCLQVSAPAPARSRRAQVQARFAFGTMPGFSERDKK
jgi:hypothetical protein